MDPSIAVSASDRVVQIKPGSDSYLLLAKTLQHSCEVQTPGCDKDSADLKRAERAIRSAFASTKQPSLEMYSVLGSILEERELASESKTAYLRAYEIAKGQNRPSDVADAIRGLIRTSSIVSNNAETDRWFAALVDSNQVSWFDRDSQAQRLYQRGNFSGAGDNYALAASPGLWGEYCVSADAYIMDGKSQDRVLEMARACIANGMNKSDSDIKVAGAHYEIAEVLNERGVYEEALSHVREAVNIQPQNAFYQDTLADSLIGLRRFQEAINASKLALRLSDGKYGWMHFTLGDAYFGIENWELARQSYEKASQLDPKDDAAAYNVAVCLARQGLLHDAADWYEEALRRNPNRVNKQELLNRIETLRK
jgi:Flp pilus assembly protein TadD